MHVLTDEQAELERVTRRFLDAAGTPISRPPGSPPALVDRSWWATAAELDWPAMVVPAAHGGANDGTRGASDAAIVARAHGRALAAGPFVCALVASAALANGEDRELLEECLAGRHLSLWLPGDFVGTDEGDGRLRISGRSRPVVQPELADSFVVPVTSARHPGHLAEAIVPASEARLLDAPGVDLTRRFGRVELEVVVHASQVMRDFAPDPEWYDARQALATVLVLADTVGILDAAFEETLSYAQQRWTFGRQIASYQAIKHRLADMALWLESSRALVAELAGASAPRGAPYGDQLSARIYIGERALALLQECMQMHGGIGVTWEHQLHWRLRRALANWAVFGSPTEDRERLLSHLLVGARSAHDRDG